MHSLSKGEGREDAANITFFRHQGPQWEICWEGLGTQPGGTDAQSRVTSGLSPCGLPGLAVSNILCDFEQVMPYLGFVFLISMDVQSQQRS